MDADQDFLPGRTEFYRIVNEIVEHLLYASHIRTDDQRPIRKVCADRQIFFLAEYLECIERMPDHLGDVKFCEIQIDTLVVEAIQQQQPFCELVQTLSLT